MKAIETVYKGYRFRSRIEARWAVFFDTIGVKWSYEEEGYILNDGSKYLPDFYLPQHGFIEIKGTQPTLEEMQLASFLGQATNKQVLIFYGQIPEPYSESYLSQSNSAILVHPYWDSDYMWCRCLVCGKIGIQFEGRSARICRHDKDDKGYNWDDKVINDAYEKARSARFEYGEHGL